MEREAASKNTSGEVGLQQREEMTHCTRREHTLVGTDVGTQTQVDWNGVLSELSALQWPLLSALSSPTGTKIISSVPIGTFLDAKIS